MANRNDKSLDTTHVPSQLIEFRKQIDAMDDEIIALLKRRSKVVSQVGEYKRAEGYKGCFIRPGREADMLRRIWNDFQDSEFSAVAACEIWRTIIAASTSIESDLRISVHAPDNDDTLYWISREYFGSFSSVIRHPNCNRVVGDVVDGKTEVGILPPLTNESDANWWMTLAQQEENAPRIFAQVPFVNSLSESNQHICFAIARIQPEPTASDITLIAVETHDISIHRLTTAFATSGMKASRIAFTNSTAGNNVCHLLQVEEFVNAEDSRFTKVLETLGEALIFGKVLGSYATPITTSSTC
ncbi:MAG: chorismate mutase [Alphaproteobacteria bacterium]|nr:chorismate mutase [Alphaproteobacteria bacterium]